MTSITSKYYPIVDEIISSLCNTNINIQINISSINMFRIDSIVNA